MTDTGRTCAVDVKTSLTSDYVVLGESPCGLPLRRASEGPCETCGFASWDRQHEGRDTNYHHAYLGPWECPLHGNVVVGEGKDVAWLRFRT